MSSLSYDGPKHVLINVLDFAEFSRVTSVQIKTYLYAFLLLNSSSNFLQLFQWRKEKSSKSRAKEMYKLVLNCNYLILIEKIYNNKP
ncbi:hypothetical protein BpHYR1_022045 [Brachionus plicatilis]|uniref:Uncharacterized protein n=1 Tax=Brachionus plicatilis TaxID=10195 RepID=A0A3M7PJR6_BRAPC|nr:hypothetical protein BpHYR1_022045 [Brachionus plicatilis]